MFIDDDIIVMSFKIYVQVIYKYHALLRVYFHSTNNND